MTAVSKGLPVWFSRVPEQAVWIEKKTFHRERGEPRMRVKRHSGLKMLLAPGGVVFLQKFRRVVSVPAIAGTALAAEV